MTIPNKNIQKARDLAADRRGLSYNATQTIVIDEILRLLTPTPKRHTFGGVEFEEGSLRRIDPDEFYLDEMGDLSYCEHDDLPTGSKFTILRPIDPSAKYREALSDLLIAAREGGLMHVAAVKRAGALMEGGAE